MLLNRDRACSLVAAVLLLIASATVVLSQVPPTGFDENDCQECDPAQLGVDKKLDNARLKFNAKVVAIQEPDVIVRGNDNVPLHFSDALAQTELAAIKEKDNIRVFGYMGTVKGRPGRFFLVQRLIHRGDDITLYKDKISALEKAGDAAGLIKLGDEIDAEGKQMKQTGVYGPVALQAYRLAIGMKEKQIAPEDQTGWIDLAAGVYHYLGDRQGALDRLVKAIKPGEPPPAAAQKLLDDLKAIQYGGKYVLFEDMKKQEGFVERDGKWVLKERAEFEDAVKAQRAAKVKPRAYLDDYYATLARDGKTETGMNKSEVAQAKGFPDDVDRMRFANSQDVYDAWRFEGQGAYYFENGILFKRPDVPR